MTWPLSNLRRTLNTSLSSIVERSLSSRESARTRRTSFGTASEAWPWIRRSPFFCTCRTMCKVELEDGAADWCWTLVRIDVCTGDTMCERFERWAPHLARACVRCLVVPDGRQLHGQLQQLLGPPPQPACLVAPHVLEGLTLHEGALHKHGSCPVEVAAPQDAKSGRVDVSWHCRVVHLWHRAL